MEINRQKRGSVLMEFIIVFPIYLVLFGGVFVIGDMMVHSTRLASAERTVAFELQSGEETGWNAIQDKLFHISDGKEITDEGEEQDVLSKEKDSVWYADTNVDHPWSHRAAIKILDKYKLLAGGTAGRLLFAKLFFDDVVPEKAKVDFDPLFTSLIKGNSIDMWSKDNGSEKNPREYTYNYYTLKKTKYDGLITWRDNRRYSSDLVAHSKEKHSWQSQVYEENYHEKVGDDETNSKKDTHRGREYADYQRYKPFVDWSE